MFHEAASQWHFSCLPACLPHRWLARCPWNSSQPCSRHPPGSCGSLPLLRCGAVRFFCCLLACLLAGTDSTVKCSAKDRRRGASSAQPDYVDGGEDRQSCRRESRLVIRDRPSPAPNVAWRNTLHSILPEIPPFQGTALHCNITGLMRSATAALPCSALLPKLP